MAEIRLTLTESETSDIERPGSIPWIIQGINLEDSQYVVFIFDKAKLNNHILGIDYGQMFVGFHMMPQPLRRLLFKRNG
jgi:hypothetical protein